MKNEIIDSNEILVHYWTVGCSENKDPRKLRPKTYDPKTKKPYNIYFSVAMREG